MDDTGAVLQQAIADHRAGRRQQAADGYARVLDADPTNPDALNLLGLLALEVGQVDRALDILGEATEVVPNSPHVWRNYADALAAAERFDDAITAYRRSIENGAGYAAPFNLGMLYIRLGRSDDALECFRAADAQSSDDPRPAHYIRVLSGETLTTTPDSVVIAEFDEMAETYDTVLTKALQCTVPRDLRALYDAVAPGASELSVLDLGCGTGLSGIAFRDIAARMCGCDLAPRILELARARGIYDELWCEDVVVSLRRFDGDLDLAVSADVFVYVGDLDASFAAAARALRPGGRLLFSVEHRDEDGFGLGISARFAHSTTYVEGLAAAHGLAVERLESSVLRFEAKAPVDGRLWSLRRPQ